MTSQEIRLLKQTQNESQFICSDALIHPIFMLPTARTDTSVLH